jgi:hypothetical protein
MEDVFFILWRIKKASYLIYLERKIPPMKIVPPSKILLKSKFGRFTNSGRFQYRPNKTTTRPGKTQAVTLQPTKMELAIINNPATKGLKLFIKTPISGMARGTVSPSKLDSSFKGFSTTFTLISVKGSVTF